MNVIIEYSSNGNSPNYNQDISNPCNVTISYYTNDENCFITYNNRNYSISINEVNDLLKNLNSVRLYELPKTGMGVDGNTYKIKIVNDFNSVVFVWWEDTCGEQWSGLFRFREKLISLVKNCLKKN